MEIDIKLQNMIWEYYKQTSRRQSTWMHQVFIRNVTKFEDGVLLPHFCTQIV